MKIYFAGNAGTKSKAIYFANIKVCRLLSYFYITEDMGIQDRAVLFEFNLYENKK